MVKCSSCDTVAKWKDMRSAKVYENYQESITDKEDSYHWVYTCKLCLSRDMDCSEQDAMADIKGAHTQWARARNVKYKAALSDRRTEFSGMSHQSLRTLVLEDLLVVLGPLAEYVSRKLIQMAKRSNGIEQHDLLLAELRIVKDKPEELKIIEALERLGREIEKDSEPLAFAEKEDATEMFAVAQYSDEWVKTPSGALRAWYVCRQTFGGQYAECGTLIPSKIWKRKHQDIASSKQKWYCVCCGARYRTQFGMLVEVHAKGISTFVVVDVCDTEVLWEQISDLWNHIPSYLLTSFTPMNPADILRPIQRSDLTMNGGVDEGVVSKILKGDDTGMVSKILDVQGFKDLPKWDRDWLFGGSGAPPAAAVPPAPPAAPPIRPVDFDGLDFGAEGLRHIPVHIYEYLATPDHLCPRCVNAFARASKATHRWYYFRFDE